MEWNCSQWRSLSPSNALNASGRHTARCIYLHSVENFLDPAVQDVIGPNEVIIVQRNLVRQSVWDFCDYWRGMGKLVVADLDDAYQIIPWSNPAHKFWGENTAKLDPLPVDSLEEGLRHVDGLTAPSKQLLEDWAHVVPGYWLPNWATGAWYANLPERERTDKLVFGWGGSVSHYDSWWGSGIREALSKICQDYPQVHVKICGNDMRIYDQLDVPDDRKTHQPGVPPAQWPGIVNTFDIGVAPLHGDYDQRRSWIKALEYMLCGIPWVATAGRPYEDFAEYGTLVEEGADNWYDALKDVIENYSDRLAQAQQNKSVGEDNTLERRIDDYASTFARIGQSRRDKRLPGIWYVNWDVGNTKAAGGDAVVAGMA